MLILHSMAGSCSLADHIALIWSGLPYKVDIVAREELKTPEYLAKNPSGQVPLLEDGSWLLTQNIAILSYVAEKSPEANLGAENTAESRAKMMSWLSYISADYHKAFGNIFGAGRFGFSPENEHNLKKAAIELLKESHLKKMDAYLANNQFIFDNRKTVADAYFWVVTSWAYGFVPSLAAEYPNLHAYFERMKADPGIQRALAEQKQA